MADDTVYYKTKKKKKKESIKVQIDSAETRVRAARFGGWWGVRRDESAVIQTGMGGCWG
jgi:hypothetical protein